MIEGLLFLCVGAGTIVYSRLHNALKELSLVSVAAVTGLLYYIAVPALAHAVGRDEFLGMQIPQFADTGALHLAATLYLAGAAIGAAIVPIRVHGIVGDARSLGSTPLGVEYMVMVALTAVAVLYLVSTNQLALFGGELSWTLRDDNLLFLTQAYNLLIVAALVYLAHTRGGRKGVLAVLLVGVLLAVVGFRFRLVLLSLGALTCFAVVSGRRPSLWLVGGGAVLALAALNIFGAIRKYGRGLDLDGLRSGEIDILRAALDPGGEIGPFLVAHQAASSGAYDSSIGVDPWLIGLARLIPSALWPQKPSAYYLVYSWDGFNYFEVANSGIAPPQLVEFLWQFGWLGLLPLSLLAYLAASLLLKQMLSWNSCYGVAGVSLVPAYFGFYMQSRGYFSQIFMDAVVMFGALALLQVARRIHRR